MDSVMSPATAVALGNAGGLGVLDLEGLWTRYEDPAPLLEEIATFDSAGATARMQEIYAAPIQPELITARLKEVRAAGVTVAGPHGPPSTHPTPPSPVAAGGGHFVVPRSTRAAA